MDVAAHMKADALGFHNSRHSWEGDYQREREARARGDEFRRFTWTDVFGDPSYLEAEICSLLPVVRS